MLWAGVLFGSGFSFLSCCLFRLSPFMMIDVRIGWNWFCCLMVVILCSLFLPFVFLFVWMQIALGEKRKSEEDCPGKSCDDVAVFCVDNEYTEPLTNTFLCDSNGFLHVIYPSDKHRIIISCVFFCLCFFCVAEDSQWSHAEVLLLIISNLRP